MSTISPTIFMQEVLTLCDAFPERRNPQVSEPAYENPVCVYDTENHSEKCLIGMYLSVYDTGSPDPLERRSAQPVMKDRGYTYDVTNLASRIQSYADNSPGKPRKWKKVAKEIRSGGFGPITPPSLFGEK